MLSCLIPSLEVQTLQKESGLSDFDFEAQVRSFLDEHGRLPYLDELRGANSEPYIKEILKLNGNNVTSIQNILETTGTSTLEEATIQLNDKYRDKEVDIIPMKEYAVVMIYDRPSVDRDISTDKYYQDKVINNTVFINQTIDRLAKVMGIQIIPMDTYELDQFIQSKGDIPGASTAKGFVYEGNIYINTDVATAETALHEMLHLILGSVKHTDPKLYASVVRKAEKFDSFGKIAKLYPNRMHSDLCEEVFITEMSRLMVGYDSPLRDLDNDTKYALSYNMYRILDTIFMGGVSTKAIPFFNLFNLNWKQVAQIVNSPIFQNVNQGILDDAMFSRIQANVKSELLANGELKENCGV